MARPKGSTLDTQVSPGKQPGLTTPASDGLRSRRGCLAGNLKVPGADFKGCRLWVDVSTTERGSTGEELRNRVLLGFWGCGALTSIECVTEQRTRGGRVGGKEG